VKDERIFLYFAGYSSTPAAAVWTDICEADRVLAAAETDLPEKGIPTAGESFWLAVFPMVV